MHHPTFTPGPPPASSLIQAIARHARERPNAQAIGEADGAGQQHTYLELAAVVASNAAELRARVPPGAVVLSLMPGGAEYVSWFCAAIAAGVRLLPMHPQIAGPEAQAVARRAGAAFAIIAPGMRAAPHLSTLGQLPFAPRHTPPHAPPFPPPGGLVLGSSGTTGPPKLALRDSASLDADAAGVIHGMNLSPSDRVLFATPLSHSYGVDVLVGALTAGATLRVLTQCDTDTLAREVAHGATVLPGVPFVFEALARQARPHDIALRLALSAGAALSSRVRAAFVGAWGVEVGQLYGATELGTVAMESPSNPGFDPGSIGKPLPGVSVRIVGVDDPLCELPPGREGHLVVRAPSMLTGYLDGEVPLVDGHLLTGDLARLDATGRVHISGRLKMLIDVGAYKVNPLEVEGVLASHPAVAECVVVPVAASESVQRLRAVVVPTQASPHPTPRELRLFLQQHLSPIKVPRIVEIVPSLPKSPTGKVLRDRV